MAGRKARLAGKPSRKPALATPRHLENAALFYLQRYSSSAENLRRVLMRRVARSAGAHGSDPEEGRATVDRLIGRLAGSGLLDDGRYADSKARSLARRGRSPRHVRAVLTQKGVPAELAETTLEQLHAEEPELDFKAAVAYARRRRLGPFRNVEERCGRRDRDLAAMARAGYSLAMARRIIDAEDGDGLLDSRLF